MECAQHGPFNDFFVAIAKDCSVSFATFRVLLKHTLFIEKDHFTDFLLQLNKLTCYLILRNFQ